MADDPDPAWGQAIAAPEIVQGEPRRFRARGHRERDLRDSVSWQFKDRGDISVKRQEFSQAGHHHRIALGPVDQENAGLDGHGSRQEMSRESLAPLPVLESEGTDDDLTVDFPGRGGEPGAR